ncbi:MAG: ATP-binding protein [Pseudomonadota bacterium]
MSAGQLRQKPRRRWRFRPGLAFRVTVPLLVASATAFLLVVFIITPRLQERMIDQAVNDTQVTLDSLSAALVRPMALGREERIFGILDRVAAKQERWVAIRAVTPAGEQIYPRNAIVLPATGPRLSLHEGVVRAGRVEIGRIQVAKDLGPLIDGAAEEALILMVVLAGTLGMVVFWSSFSLSNGVIEPTLQLQEAAEALARREYTAALPRPPRHEIGDLIESFTWMREALAKSEGSALAQRNGELARLLEREQELRRNAQLLEQVVRNTNAGIAILECSGSARIIRRVNAAFSQLTSLGPRETLGLDMLTMLAFESETDLARLRARQGGGSHGHVGEAELLDTQGKPTGIWVEMATARVDDPREKVELIALMIRDVTRRRAAERDLRAERDRARAESEEKSRFVAAVSHELRTPMTAITGIADLLMETPLSGEQRRQIDTILTASTALVEVVNDVLDFSKLEAGRLQPRREVIDPTAVLDAVVRLLTPLAQAKGIGLQHRVAEGVPPQILGDEGRLRQCLLNLAGNAIKFTDSGHVRVDAGVEDGALRIAVTDTGPGIAPEDQARVFEPFRQIGAGNVVGTGLGLAITAALVAAMQGSIGVESTPGEGSTFNMTLPITPAPGESAEGMSGADPIRAAKPAADRDIADALLRQAPGAMSPAAAGAAVGRAAAGATASTDLTGQRVLVVDDTETNRVVFRQMLRLGGAEVGLAVDGQDAIEQVIASRPDLVLMDITMPRLDGIAATRALRQAEATGGMPPVPILGLSAGSAEEERKRCLEAGMNGFISKPVRKVDLLRQCATALAEAPLQQAS